MPRRPILSALFAVLCAFAVRGALAAGDSAIATFAGGCFWCMEPPFDAQDGVLETISGYTGGTVADPSYEQVSAGGTGHLEAVTVRYDPTRVSYEQLLAVFWRNIDPTRNDGQFSDVGTQSRPAIFVHDDAQRAAAEASRAALVAARPFAAEVLTEILPAGPCHAAEDYHQDYYLKNPVRYKFYRYSCGRDERLEELWGKPD